MTSDSAAALEPEVHTVTDDEVVVFRGPERRTYGGLAPDTEHELDGVTVRTLPTQRGELLCTFATVNDVHFGEVECGVIDGIDIGPVLRVEPGERPHPDVMNEAAIAEIATVADGRGPEVVVAKGDLTTHGTVEEYEQFLAAYGSAFGDTLVQVRGNHDAYHGAVFAAAPTTSVVLPGVILAVLDTTIPGRASGRVTADQLEWLDTLAAEADRAVLVFGHHHCWDPSSRRREPNYFGINPDDSERLVDVVARRRRITGYFAGHTHRNRVRQFAATGSVPWVEVACVKDFPGSWAEYRVHDGGVLQVHRRIATPDALRWSERCRAMFGGLYTGYALGRLEDRCFAVSPR